MTDNISVNTSSLKDQRKYTIAILEDKVSDYKTFKKKVESLSPLLKLDAKLDCIENTEFAYFERYVAKVIDSPAEIFIVDWELGFEKNPTALDLFNVIKKTRPEFQFGDRFWIICSLSDKYAIEVPTEVRKLFHQGVKCYDHNSKDLLMDEKLTRDFFKEAIDQAIEYLKTAEVPSSIGELPKKERGTPLNIVNFDGSFYDLELPSEVWRFSQLKLVEERFLCVVHNRNLGFLLYFDEHDVLKIVAVKTGESMTALNGRLKMMSTATGLIYNPDFFVVSERKKFRLKNQLKLKEPYFQYVNRRLSLLENVERFKERPNSWYKSHSDLSEKLGKIFSRMVLYGLRYP